MSLDATVGGADSNSYTTVAEADAYFDDRDHSAAWDTYSDKAQALITASSLLDWYVNWKGTRVDDTQSMDWPRSDVYNKIGELYSETVIPPDVKTAVYELALSSLSDDRTVDNDLAGIDTAKIGSLSIKATTGGYYSTVPDTIPEKIWKILTGLYIKSSGLTVRLIRA